MLRAEFPGSTGQGEAPIPSAASKPQATKWLLENGPRELESLLRSIVYHPSSPILITDNDRHYKDASSGAGKLLGVPREKIIGRKLDDFVEPSYKPQVAELWQALLQTGEQKGKLRLAGPDGRPREIEFIAKGNLLPERQLLVLQNQTSLDTFGQIPAWVQDYALFLLNTSGEIATWYSGAERIYGYSSAEAIGEHVSLLYPADETLHAKLAEEFRRAESGGHFANEDWCAKRDGLRFWANVVTMALKDERGDLQGFARVVRDFSGRHERDEKLRQTRPASRVTLQEDHSIAGFVSGEFDQIPEANDAFLELVGYTREDLSQGKLIWPDLTPPEYIALDELAHEECLKFGACEPVEKELLRKDGSRVAVCIATALLKLSPFRWISFVRESQSAGGSEQVESAADSKNHFEEIIGSSAALKRILGQVELVAPASSTVLILGETGTGKELIARAVHRLSPRRDRAFISLNCAAIPTGLLESELFGYERGAFTGALSQKIGRFEMANHGTLFLDEVGDIPLDLQPKLLRALQEKAFERLGGTKTIPIDVRLVAATNRNLTQMMGDKLFRSDLYYRLKVFPITTPPLRDRPEDIPALVWHFTHKYAEQMGKPIDKIPPETMRALVSWSWPGNIRELENFIERAVILSRGPELRAPLEEIREDAVEGTAAGTLEQVERDYIIRVLKETGGVVSKAAIRLGMPRTTLNAMMRKLSISPKNL